jgi:hypothetical protein
MAALVAFGAVAPPSPVSASPAANGYRATSPEYGMSVFVYNNPATTDRDFANVRNLRFGWQKTLFQWRMLEPVKSQFDWTESDRVVAKSAQHGLKIIARIDFQPMWARADGANNGAPDNYQDFADFIRAFVSRYSAGSAYGTVHAVEIWNETNLMREWGSPISPQSAADYVLMLSMAYQAAKEADPSVTVISAGLSPTGWSDDTARPDDEYLQWMFDAGLKGNYDVLGAHGNTQCPSVEVEVGACPIQADRMQHGSFYFRRVEKLREIMEYNGDADKQVWILEFGWTSDSVNQQYSWFATTEAIKADLIVRGFQFARLNWAPWIGVMILWTLPDPSWNWDREELWWAITNPDGTPRPAYNRLLQARQTGELP